MVKECSPAGMATTTVSPSSRAVMGSPASVVAVTASGDRRPSSARWAEFADILHDCRALLVSAAGPQPKRALEEHGVAVEAIINETFRDALDSLRQVAAKTTMELDSTVTRLLQVEEHLAKHLKQLKLSRGVES